MQVSEPCHTYTHTHTPCVHNSNVLRLAVSLEWRHNSQRHGAALWAPNKGPQSQAIGHSKFVGVGSNLLFTAYSLEAADLILQAGRVRDKFGTGLDRFRMASGQLRDRFSTEQVRDELGTLSGRVWPTFGSPGAKSCGRRRSRKLEECIRAFADAAAAAKSLKTKLYYSRFPSIISWTHKFTTAERSFSRLGLRGRRRRPRPPPPSRGRGSP